MTVEEFISFAATSCLTCAVSAVAPESRLARALVRALRVQAAGMQTAPVAAVATFVDVWNNGAQRAASYNPQEETALQSCRCGGSFCLQLETKFPKLT